MPASKALLNTERKIMFECGKKDRPERLPGGRDERGMLDGCTVYFLGVGVLTVPFFIADSFCDALGVSAD